MTDLDQDPEFEHPNNHAALLEVGRKKPSTVKNNVVNRVEMEAIIEHVLHNVSEIVAKTLGPFGANTLIVQPYETVPVHPTKDGFRVIQSIRYDDVTFNAVYGAERDLSSRMNMNVGDSTTTGHVIIANLFSALKRIRRFYGESAEIVPYTFRGLQFIPTKHSVTPYGIKNILDAIEVVLCKIIEENYVVKWKTHEQRVELIRRVAAVSANNNKMIGDTVADIIREYSEGTADEIFIDVERSDGERTEVQQKRGFQFGAGFTHFTMANTFDGTVEYKNPCFLLINGPLTANDAPTIRKMIEIVAIQRNEPLIIMASEFTSEINNLFFQMRSGVKVMNAKQEEKIIVAPVVGITMEMMSPEAQERLRDLEIALGAKALATQQGKIIDFDALADYALVIGHAEYIKSQPNLTSILNGRGNLQEIERRVSELREHRVKFALSDSPHDQFQLSKIDRRIGMLRSNMAAIKVGGRTIKEKEYTYDLYVDAVAASMAVLRHGATLGGNRSVISAIDFLGDITKNEDGTIVDLVVEELGKQNKIIVIGNDPVETKNAVRSVLTAVRFAFQTPFLQVLLNATQEEESALKLLESIDTGSSNPSVLNLLTGKVETFEKSEDLAGVNAQLLVAGNTDTELLKSVFIVLSTFLMANQILDVQYG